MNFGIEVSAKCTFCFFLMWQRLFFSPAEFGSIVAVVLSGETQNSYKQSLKMLFLTFDGVFLLFLFATLMIIVFIVIADAACDAEIVN
jgi:uncharacterized membrane protein (UPF0182 family)